MLEEPTVAAIVVEEQKMVAWGQEAQDMFGRVPDTSRFPVRLRTGVIADYEVTEPILSIASEKVAADACFPAPGDDHRPYGVTSVESRAVHEATLQAGGREAI